MANVNGSVGIWNNGSRSDSIIFQTFQSRNFTVSSAGGGGYNGLQIRTGLSLAMRHVIVNGLNVSVDDNSYTWERGWSGGGISQNYFALFGCYNTSSGIVNCQSCQIGKCTLYSGDVVVYDFQPVLFTNELGQSEGAMYDRVSGELDPFRNRGTGAFLWGPDASVQMGGGGGIP